MAERGVRIRLGPYCRDARAQGERGTQQFLRTIRPLEVLQREELASTTLADGGEPKFWVAIHLSRQEDALTADHFIKLTSVTTRNCAHRARYAA